MDSSYHRAVPAKENAFQTMRIKTVNYPALFPKTGYDGVNNRTITPVTLMIKLICVNKNMQINLPSKIRKKAFINIMTTYI